MESRHEKVVATQNSVNGKTVRSRHETVVTTQTLGDQKVDATRIKLAYNRNGVATKKLCCDT